MWGTDGVLDAMHATPFGELPGSVVINFAIIDAVCHAWDLSASVGRPIEFTPEELPTISAIVEAICTDDARGAGSDQVPHRAARRRHRDRAVDGRGRPDHFPLGLHPVGQKVAICNAGVPSRHHLPGCAHALTVAPH